MRLERTLSGECWVNTASSGGSTPVSDGLGSLSGSGRKLGLSLLLLLLLDLLRITVEEHINHDVPAI